MQIVVNGEMREVGDEMTVSSLLATMGLDRAACAVEVNGQLVPRAQHGECVLRDGDRVELVTLVGGG